MTDTLTVRQPDFLAPDVLANPYPLYAALRAESDVAASRGRATRRLFGYTEVAAVLRDSRFSVERVLPALDRAYLFGYRGEDRQRAATIVATRHDMLLYADPPRHTRLRKLVQPFFTPQAVAALRPRIEQIVANLIERARPNGGMNAIADLASPLPTMLIAEIIGFPPDDHDHLRYWSSDFSSFIGVGRPDAARNDAVLKSGNTFTEYLTGLVESRRQEPTGDLLSALALAETHGQLTSRELLATCLTLLIAGHETTVGLIGNGLLALLRHPDQLELLRGHPALIDPAIDELARFDGPVQLTTLAAREDLTIDERPFRRGALVECWIGAANRDPAQFPDPDWLDLRRSPNRHLAFGVGTHFCLGAALGRLEAAVALNAVVQAFPNLRLADGAIAWRPSVVFRSPVALPVEFH